MRVGVPAEVRPGERRVAVVPDAVPRLIQAGLEVVVESGAGRHAYASDDAYEAAGARVLDAAGALAADAVLTVRPLEPAQVARHLTPGAVTVGFLAPASYLDSVVALRDRGVSAFSLDLLPRISRAQSMDALSSQAVVSGYHAALIAAHRLPRFFPLLMTAAGTVRPATVLVMGAGVAGLQAVATCRRLGAVVEAYDVRAAAAEEVRSLGASFVELGLETQEGAGGYAREAGEDFLRRQRELIAEHVAAADAVITTAAIPGRTAPVLVTREMVEAMKPGSIIVDLAAESGGNCELSEPGQELWHGDVLVWGAQDVPSAMAEHASRLYARNVSELLLLMVTDGVVRLDFDDEVVSGSCVTHAGEVRHEPTRALLEEESA